MQPGNGGSNANAAKPVKQRRSFIACKRCHAQRIRCDAAAKGLPCSNCATRGIADCQFIDTKRRR